MESDMDRELMELRKRRLEQLMGKKSAAPSGASQFPSSPVVVTDLNFEETMARYPLVVVDCWAPWCAPCRMIAPVVEEMSRDYAGKIVFAKLNVDENQRTAMKYQTMSIPTLLVFKNGRLVDRIVGAMPRRMLEPQIIRHLNKGEE